MTIFQFVGTDQIIVPSIGAGFIGGQLGQGNGFLPPSGLGVDAYGQQQIAQPRHHWHSPFRTASSAARNTASAPPASATAFSARSFGGNGAD